MALRVGLSLHGASLSEQGARFASQLGVRDVVVHFTNYTRNSDNASYLAGGVCPINGECIDASLWSYDTMAGMVAMLARHGLSVAAMENISPNFWFDILLDGPHKLEQMQAMKRLVRDAGRAAFRSSAIIFRWPASSASASARSRARLSGCRCRRTICTCSTAPASVPIDKSVTFSRF